MLTNKHRRNYSIRNSSVDNNASLMNAKVRWRREYLHSHKKFPYKSLTTNKAESGKYGGEIWPISLFQLLCLHNKLPLNSALLNRQLLCSWILEARSLVKEHQGWLVPVPWCWGSRLENLKANNWEPQILSMWLVGLSCRVVAAWIHHCN